MSYVIERTEVFDVKREPGWILVYGRRKVGKTFLVKRFLDYDAYFLVRRDLAVISGDERLGPRELVSRVREMLRRGLTVVVDEFQRLPDYFADEVAECHPSGRLILLGSSLRVVHRVISPRSPLLGLVAAYRLGLLRPTDIAVYLARRLGAERALELSPLLREPWLLKYLDVYGGDPVRFAYEVVRGNAAAIKSLVGEVFSEEERSLTARYEAVVYAVASGLWSVKRVTAELFSRGLIDRPDTGLVRQYIHNLAEMGLLKVVPLLGRREKMLKIASPIVDLYYYLDSRYCVEEEGFPPYGEVGDAIRTKLGLYVQDLVAELYSQVYGLRWAAYVTPSAEVDFALVRRRKPVLAAEVKWRKGVSSRDVQRFAERAAALGARRLLFVSREPVSSAGGVDVKTPEDVVNDARRWIRENYPDSSLLD